MYAAVGIKARGAFFSEEIYPPPPPPWTGEWNGTRVFLSRGRWNMNALRLPLTFLPSSNVPGVQFIVERFAGLSRVKNRESSCIEGKLITGNSLALSTGRNQLKGIFPSPWAYHFPLSLFNTFFNRLRDDADSFFHLPQGPQHPLCLDFNPRGQ